MKHPYIVCAFFLCATLDLARQAVAQQIPAPPIQWERAYPQGGINCIRLTADGGYIIAGDGRGDTAIAVDHGGGDCWVAKTDPMGVIQWQHYYGGSAYETAYSIQQTNDGGYIVAGSSDSRDGDVTGYHVGFSPFDSTPTHDFWIFKIDATGALQWEKCFGGSGYDEARCIRQTNDGGYIAVGYSDSHDGDVTGHVPGDYNNIWIVKLDQNGGLQWERSYGGNSDDYAYSIQQTQDSGYIVGGNIYDGIHEYYWILKLNSSGGLQWAKTYGGTGNTGIVTGIQRTKDGGYVAGGFINVSNGDVTGHHEGFDSTTTYDSTDDYWIIKLDSLGALQWEKSLGGSGEDAAFDMQQMTDGGYIIAGLSTSTDGDVTGHHAPSDNIYDNDDFWVVKLDGSGALQWEKCYGGSKVDYANSIRQTTDGGCIVAGNSNSTDGDVTGNPNGGGWVVKLPPIAPVITSLRQLPSALLCATTQNDTVWVRNEGMKTLAINSASLNSISPAYTFLSPTTFPDSIAPGDSVACVLRFSTSGAGTYGDTLVLTDNDTITGHNPWKIALVGRKDRIGFALAAIAGDTLNFGELACGTAKDTSFTIIDSSTITTTFLLQINGSLFTVPSSLTADSGMSQKITAHFAGNTAAGTYIAPLVIADTCGIAKTIYLKAKVDSSSFTVTALQDTTVCPGSSFIRSVRVRNTSRVAQNINLEPTGDSNYFALSPATVTLAPGDSAVLQLSFLNDQYSGTYTISYPLPGCNGVQAVTETVHVDSIRLASLSLPDTTICPGDSAVRYITIRNLRSQPQIVQVVPANPMFSIAPDSLALGANDSSRIRIVFHGSSVIGSDTMSYTLLDACNGSYVYTMVVNVSAAEIETEPVADTTICPGDSAVRFITLHNVSTVPQQLVLLDSLPFSFSPDTVSIPAGDSATITLTFHGPSDTGTYKESYTLSNCGGGNSLAATVRVRQANIAVPQMLSVNICPNTPAVVSFPITNNDTITRVLLFTDSNCTISKTTVTLAAGATDSLQATFAGGAAGTYACVVHIADDCGGTRDVTMTVNVQTISPLSLALVPDAAPVKVGGEVKIYLTATPPSSVTGALTFTVANDPEILRFIGVRSLCGANVQSTPRSTMITLSGCPTFTSDTIAELDYEALAGPTLTTSAQIVTAASTNACETVSASGVATLTLLPPSCDIGTIGIEPNTTSLGAIYPDPATAAVTVTYTTIEDAPVRISLTDELGRTVQTLVDSYQKHGTYLAEFDAHGLPNGIYLVTMQEGLYTGAREILVLK